MMEDLDMLFEVGILWYFLWCIEGVGEGEALLSRLHVELIRSEGYGSETDIDEF